MKTSRTPNTKDEIMSVERSVGKVFPKKWNSTFNGLIREIQQKREITIRIKINKSLTNIFYNFPFSSFVLQGTQCFDTGRTSRRFKSIGPPHSSQVPYVPSSIRSSASSPPWR